MFKRIFQIGAALLILILGTPILFEGSQRNYLMSFLLPNEMDKTESSSEIDEISENCWSYWHLGIISKTIDTPLAIKHVSNALECDPRYIPLAESLFPESVDLAQLAVELHPDVAEGWFWLGGLVPSRQIEYFRTGLGIDPKEGRRWYELGRLLKDVDPEASMQAFLEGCFHGDPGYNSCLGAGNLAKEMGNYDLAIQYYRLSAWKPISSMGDNLERDLLDGKLP